MLFIYSLLPFRMNVKANKIYSNEEEIDVKLEPFKPVELPDDIATSYVNSYEKVVFLGGATLKEAEATALKHKIKINGNEPKSEEPEKVIPEFDPVVYLEINRPHSKESLAGLQRKELFAIAGTLELQVPGNISNEKLVNKILEVVTEQVE